MLKKKNLKLFIMFFNMKDSLKTDGKKYVMILYFIVVFNF